MNHTEKLRSLINKRILVAANSKGYTHSAQEVVEIKILEVSPAGTFVKTMDQYGNKNWKHASTITPIEVLEDLEKHPMSKSKKKKGDTPLHGPEFG